MGITDLVFPTNTETIKLATENLSVISLLSRNTVESKMIKFENKNKDRDLANANLKAWKIVLI